MVPEHNARGGPQWGSTVSPPEQTPWVPLTSCLSLPITDRGIGQLERYLSLKTNILSSRVIVKTLANISLVKIR